MIGWTKNRKRCKTHGLVLRGRPGGYNNTGDYCPACGERLTVVSIPYLFQVYFHPAIMIVPGILIFALGLFMFLDVRGCIVESRKTAAAIKAESQELRDRVMVSMPSEWKTVYSGMASSGYGSERWTMLSDYLESRPENEKMPFLSSDQIRVFLDKLNVGKKDEGFAVIIKYMEKEK